MSSGSPVDPKNPVRLQQACKKVYPMNHTLLLTVSALSVAAISILAAAPQSAQAATCASGVYRAGCAGPNGAVVVRKPPPPRQQTVKCANGVYRAGCVGPNGAAVVKKY